MIWEYASVLWKNKNNKLFVIPSHFSSELPLRGINYESKYQNNNGSYSFSGFKYF